MNLAEEIKKYEFYHIFDLGNGVSTPGYKSLVLVQQVVKDAMATVDFKDKRVLDIGCRDGLFSFEAEKAGAKEVIGIDSMISKGAVELLIPHFNSKVKMIEMSLYDLTPEKLGTFDIIIYPGVLYHLRYPFTSLKIIRDMLKPGGKLILETAIMRSWKFNKLEKMALLFCPTEKESPYEPTSVTFFNTKGMKDSLRTLKYEPETVNFLYDGIFGKAMPFIKKLKWWLMYLYKQYYIDRGTFVCTAGVAENEETVKYWHQTYSGDDIQELAAQHKPK